MCKSPCHSDPCNLVHVSTHSHTSTSKNNLSVAVLNARSVRNKTLAINEFVTDHDVDILAITETWLKKNSDKPIIAELTPSGYTFINVPRAAGRSGSVGVIHRNNLPCKMLPKQNYVTFELMRIQFTGATSRSFNIYKLYRPPSSVGLPGSPQSSTWK